MISGIVVLSIFTVVVTVVRIVITSVALDCIGSHLSSALEWRLVLVSAYPLSLRLLVSLEHGNTITKSAYCRLFFHFF